MSNSSLHPDPDHSVKIPHLVFGLLFLGLAGIWALVVTDVITAGRLTVVAPALLIAAGVIGLAASLAGTRNRSRDRAQHVPQTSDPHQVATGDDPTEEIR